MIAKNGIASEIKLISEVNINGNIPIINIKVME